MGWLAAMHSLEAQPNRTDQLLDQVYAVHATHALPDQAYLRAGFATDELTPVQKAFYPHIRKTVHFSLGELVRPVEGFKSWESCPYAVVTPLRSLLPQLINLNCYDTFILGDLKLTPETYLVIPVTMACKSQATLVTYDPSQKTLRQTVDELIASRGGWHIVMDERDIEDALHEAYLEGRNINTREFFAPIQEGRPWLAVGLRFDPLEGEHYRLSQMERKLVAFAMAVLSKDEDGGDVKDVEIKQIIDGVQDDFNQWSQSLVGFTWGPESQQAYKSIQQTIQAWRGLMQEELRTRKIYRKSLIAAPDDFLIQCAEMLSQPEALHAFIDQNEQQLLDLE